MKLVIVNCKCGGEYIGTGEQKYKQGRYYYVHYCSNCNDFILGENLYPYIDNRINKSNSKINYVINILIFLFLIHLLIELI